MNGRLEKIEFIKNMTVFKDFQWASSLRDRGNNEVKFKKINIYYGRNYSGKTTLSRILRALETGSLSDKFSSPEFLLSSIDVPGMQTVAKFVLRKIKEADPERYACLLQSIGVSETSVQES